MAEAGQERSPSEESGTTLEEESSSYLTPLQQSLLFELTTRRKRIAAAHLKAEFWLKRQNEQTKDQFDSSILDDEVLDGLIVERKEELIRLKEAKELKTAIVQAADAAHAINASMAAYPPIFPGAPLPPLSRHPLRYMAARRDQLALDFLALDASIKELRSQRMDMAGKIESTRRQTSSLIEEVRKRADALQDERQGGHQPLTSKQSEKSQILDETLQTARGKRELVKGVLRGLILESGLDWYGNRELRELMLELEDDDLDASEDEPDFNSDSSSDDG